jgi:hypothetical protein
MLSGLRKDIFGGEIELDDRSCCVSLEDLGNHESEIVSREATVDKMTRS